MLYNYNYFSIIIILFYYLQGWQKTRFFRNKPKKPVFFGLTLSDPGYFRQLTIRGGALKAPPYDLENYCVNLHHIIHVNFTRCFWHDPIEIFQKFAILTILQRFQNKK